MERNKAMICFCFTNTFFREGMIQIFYTILRNWNKLELFRKCQNKEVLVSRGMCMCVCVCVRALARRVCVCVCVCVFFCRCFFLSME